MARPETRRSAPPDDPSLADIADLAQALGTDLEQGLGAEQAANRLRADGPNELRAVPPVPAWRLALAQLQDPLVYLLGAAAAVALAAWWFDGRGRPGAAGWPLDASVIAGVVVLNAVLGWLQEAKAAQAVQKDAALLPAPAALGDRLNMVFKGTAVAQGSGRALVTATGMQTEVGGIATLLDTTPDAPTPLQGQIAHLGKVLGITALAIAAVVVATILLVSDIHGVADVITVLLGVSLAVAAVPEGLPAMLSVVMAMLATQILWINLITDTGPALAMGVDPIADDVMTWPSAPCRSRPANGACV